MQPSTIAFEEDILPLNHPPTENPPASSPLYLKLRDQVLNLKATDPIPKSNQKNPPLLAIVMETRLPQGTLDLAISHEGYASLYFSNGETWIGISSFPDIFQKSLEILKITQTLLPTFKEIHNHPPPFPPLHGTQFFAVLPKKLLQKDCSLAAPHLPTQNLIFKFQDLLLKIQEKN